MKSVVVALSFLVACGGAAMAQTGSKGSTSSSGSSAGSTPAAPVGHRQPRAGDVPNDRNITDPNDPLSKENQALDKKIKSICRGC